MNVYFGKDLRLPIYYALSMITNYLDKVLDIYEITMSDYETKHSEDKLRKNTIYIIDGDPDVSQYLKNDIYDGITKGYLGNASLTVSMHDSKILFKSEEDG